MSVELNQCLDCGAGGGSDLGWVDPDRQSRVRQDINDKPKYAKLYTWIRGEGYMTRTLIVVAGLAAAAWVLPVEAHESHDKVAVLRCTTGLDGGISVSSSSVTSATGGDDPSWGQMCRGGIELAPSRFEHGAPIDNNFLHH